MADDSVKSIFDLDEFKPYAGQMDARRKRFVANWNLYKAENYKLGEERFRTEIGQYVVQRIADAIRPVFTPLARAVNLDVALIPGGWALAEESQAHQAAWEIVARASRWNVEGDLYTRFVCGMGEAGLYVVDDRTAGRVYLQALRPDAYLIIPNSRFDTTARMAILLARTFDAEGKEQEEATVIDARLIRTFVNGQPQALYGNAASYANQLGFVPVVECKNDPGDGWGEPTFDDAVASLDQVNLQATYLGNIIQKHAEPQWAAFGAEKGDLEKSGDTVWFFPEGSDVKAILAAVDFAGVLSFIDNMKEEVKESLPELSLSKLVGLNRVATDTIEIQMIEAVTKIKRLRKPIDLALADALRLVGRAAVNMRLPALAGLTDEALTFDEARPVIAMDALMKLSVQQQSQAAEMSALALERERMLMANGEGEDDA